MTRMVPRVMLIVAALFLLIPSVVLGQSSQVDGVLFGVRNDVTLPAGREADAIIVIQGSATVEGSAKALLVIDGQAVVTGPSAQVGDIVAIKGSVEVGPGASVERISHIDSTITVAPTADVAEQRDVRDDLVRVAGALGFLVFVLWIGSAIAALVAGLFAAGLAASQVRRAGWLIGSDTLKVIVVGLLAMIAPPILAALLMVTMVGIPLAFWLLIMWGLVSVLGWLVVAVWIGEKLLRRKNVQRPYAASILGVLILLLASLIPLVTAIVWWIGLGAVTLAGWRVLRGRGGAEPVPYPGYGPPQGWWQPAPGAPPPGPQGWPPEQGWQGPQTGYGGAPGWGPPPSQGTGWGPPPGSGWDQSPPPTSWEQNPPPTSWDQRR